MTNQFKLVNVKGQSKAEKNCHLKFKIKKLEIKQI